jgi:gas vesicle protein
MMAKKNKKNGADANGTDTAYESGRQSGARRQRLASNPVSALLGGFAVGAVLGAVVPTSSRERRALKPVGAKVSDAAREAARQAADKGRDKLNRVTGEVMTQVGSKMVDAVVPPKEQTTA